MPEVTTIEVSILEPTTTKVTIYEVCNTEVNVSKATSTQVIRSASMNYDNQSTRVAEPRII